MHGQQSEERQQQHMCSPPSQRSSPGNTDSAYKAFSKGGRTLKLGDCALFQAGNALPFIGILRKVTYEKEDQVKLAVNWLYRPADVKLGKGVPLEAAPNEIFYSFHKDDISAASLLHPCKVAFLGKGVDLPPGVSSFVCRRVYDTANKCLWWLTDRDYTDEHQEEVDQLLDRTKLEMQAAVQSGVPSPRVLTGPTSSQQLKVSVESPQNGSYFTSGKGKKRERADQNLDPSKRERNLKLEDADASPLKRERSMKLEEIATILDKDGGLLKVADVERLVQLMQHEQNDVNRKVADVAARRTMLAGIVAGTEKEDCLNKFVHLGGLRLLDEWLQEAHKGKVGDAGSPKEGDKGVEDLLLALLRALDRLPVDLEALKTCIVGKSVNHLRSHKNLDIQKKARKLVDVWKKRVDIEMKLSGEVKPGSGHGISWSYKQSADLVHSLSMKGPGGAPEVAVKSSGAFAGNAKAAPNGSNSGDASVKPQGLSSGGKSNSPTLPTPKDSNSKLSAISVPSDIAGGLVKEEKSSSSSHSPSNGHSWGSGAGKSGSMSWKDDAKNGTMFSVNANSKTPPPVVSRVSNVHNKGLLGASLSGGSKEVGSGKPLVWSRSAVAEKPASPVSAPEKTTAESSLSSQQRLIVRIPNPGRSPAQTSAGSGEAAGPISRSSSPGALERQHSTGLADVSDGKPRPLAECQAASSLEGSETQAGSGGRPGTPASEDKGKHQSNMGAVVECDKKVVDDVNCRGKAGDVEAEGVSKDPDTCPGRSGCKATRPHKVPGVEDIRKKDSNTSNVVVSGEDGPPRNSQSSPMEVDEGAMSLLATVAAAAEERVRGTAPGAPERVSGREPKGDSDLKARNSLDVGQLHANGNSAHVVTEDGGPQRRDHVETAVLRTPVSNEMSSVQNAKDSGKIDHKDHHEGGRFVPQGSSSHSDSKRESECLSVEQEVGGKRCETELSMREEACRNGVMLSGLPNAAKVGVEHLSEDRRLEEVSAKLATDPTFSKDYMVSGKHGLESKLSGFDGPLSSKFWKREITSEDRQLSRTHSKVSKSAMELCNGIGVGGVDYRSNLGGTCMESRMQEEKDGKKRVQDVGQPFGRRGDSDAQRIADLVSGFPEEDVLEVARQAANEVEQMEKYGKPASSSSLERDGSDARRLGMPNGSEPRDSGAVDTSAREHRRISSVDDRPKESNCDTRDQRYPARSLVAHPDDAQRTGTENIDEAAMAAKASDPGEGEEADKATSLDRSLERKGSSLKGQDMDLILEAAQDDLRRVDSSHQLSKGSSFPPTQLADGGATHALPQGSQPVVKPSTPQQAAESSGPSDALVGGSDGSERPDFDLNEGFPSEDGPHDDATTPLPANPAPSAAHAHPIASAASASGVAAPIAVLAFTKGAFIPPASPMRIKGELGWKGSAATSAFRPAEPRRTPDRQNSNAESIASDANLALANASVPKRARPLLEFDLNVADERVMEDAGVAATTLSSQGSVLGMSLQNHSLPSSSVSGVTFIKQESSSLTFLKPESSSSANPLSNGGYGGMRASPGQAPSSSGRIAARPNLDLDLNRMDDSEESGPPFSADPRAGIEGVGSSARSNNSTTQPPRRVMDFDLNDGPSFEEVGGDEPALQPLLFRKPPGHNSLPPMAYSGLRMEGRENTLSAWYSAPNGSYPPPLHLPPHLPYFPGGSGYSAAAAGVPLSFLNPGAVTAPGGNGSNGEMFRAGSAPSASPGVAHPPPDRRTFGYSSFPVFANAPNFHPSSAPFSGNSSPFGDSSGPLPFPVISSQLMSPATNSSTYTRSPYLIGLPEVEDGSRWSRATLDLNAGPLGEPSDTDSTREDLIHGRLPPLHPGVPGVFNEQMRATLAQVASSNPELTPPPLKRKEPEGGWNFYTGAGGFKQTTWR